jgi:ABC-type multidrug transport system ATPase subunit
MTEILKLRSVGLAAHGPVLTLSLNPGQAVAIVGPAASGKSRLLRFIAGQEAPPTGQVELGARAGWPAAIKDKKLTPQHLARTGASQGQAGRASEALNATRLWEARQSPVSELSPSQQTACELLGVLSHEGELICLDGYLDLLDPWALRSTWELLRKRMTSGCGLALVTNRPDVVEQCDLVVAVSAGQVKHAGRVLDLPRKATHDLEVATENQAGVRALVAPFVIEVTHQSGAVKLRAEDGQQLAAKLLMEGYGDVRYVVHRQPTLEECLLGLI